MREQNFVAFAVCLTKSGLVERSEYFAVQNIFHRVFGPRRRGTLDLSTGRTQTQTIVRMLEWQGFPIERVEFFIGSKNPK